MNPPAVALMPVFALLGLTEAGRALPVRAIVLVLVSACMHAGWNLLARRQRSEAAFLYRAVVVIVVITLIPAVISECMTRSISWVAWQCVIGSGACCAVYLFGLTRAYGRSDFTIVYPVARALPVILVGLGDVARGRAFTPAGWGGVVLVVVGCLLCPLRSFREFRWSRYFNHASFYVVLTALGTVGYSLLDKVASEHVAAGAFTAARYCSFYFASELIFYLPMIRLFGKGEERDPSVGWTLPALAGALVFGAYWLILWSFQMTRQAGYVVAFRQFSIVLGVVLAFILYKERGKAVRITGALLITAGLILIGIWGK